MFNLIDLNNYNRKEHYEAYMFNVPCTYSITVQLNITNFYKSVKSKNIKFYASVIYLISKVVNRYKEFKMSLNDNKELGYYDIVYPSYTIFHDDTKTFSSIYTEYDENFDTFYKNYISDIETYGNNKLFLAKPCNVKNIFNISSMQSFAGQRSQHLGKKTEQLAKQETGSPIVAKGNFTFAATPSARGGSYKKTVRKANLLTSLNAKKLSNLVANPTKNPTRQAAQAQAFAVRNKTSVNVILTNSRGHKGIYKVSKKSVTLLYNLRNKRTNIKRTQWLQVATNKTLASADMIYSKEANKRLEKALSKGLSTS